LSEESVCLDYDIVLSSTMREDVFTKVSKTSGKEKDKAHLELAKWQ